MIFRVQDVDICKAAPLPEAPKGWTFAWIARIDAGDCAVYKHNFSTLTVLRSIDDLGDGKPVLHVSVSRKGKLPSWEDLRLCKTLFMGPDVDAYHVIPRASDHVNMHNFTMHLWTPWEDKACSKS